MAKLSKPAKIYLAIVFFILYAPIFYLIFIPSIAEAPCRALKISL